jgi:hypothetical protein
MATAGTTTQAPAVSAELRAAVDEWNALDAEGDQLWEENGKPSGRGWSELAAPLWERAELAEERLAPLLFEWAKSSGLTKLTVFSYWITDYAQVRKLTGLNAIGHRIRPWIDYAANIDAQASWVEWAKGVPEDEWDDRPAVLCTASPEGEATEDLLLDWKKNQAAK